LDQYSTDSKLGVPHCCGDDNILILKPKIATGTYDDSDYTDGYIKCRLHHPNVVKADELDKNCMVVMNFWYFNTLIDIKPEKGSLYMHSLSEPFDEEMEISFKRMMNWLNYFKLNFVQNHCSGHATGLDIKEMVKEINPKILFPIHTEFPGVFRRFGVKNKLVKYGKEYKIQ
jgi:ribonuclease J